MQETWVRSLAWEDPMEKEMPTHSSVLAWKIPREETGGLQTGCKRVGHNLATKQHLSMDTWGAATFSVLLDEYQK